MLKILLVYNSSYTFILTDDIVPKDGAKLQPKNYYIDDKSKLLHILGFADL